MSGCEPQSPSRSMRWALPKAITRGTGSANNSPIPVASPFHHSVEAQLRQVNVVKARELLKAGGYDGRAIKLVTSRRDPQMFDAAVVIQAMAAEAGLQLQNRHGRLARTPVSLHCRHLSAHGAVILRPADPALSFGVFIGDKREDLQVWDTPRSCELFDQTLQTADPASRQAVFDTLTRDFLKFPGCAVQLIASVGSAISGDRSSNWMSSPATTLGCQPALTYTMLATSANDCC